jgi:DNA-binding beta-propeller fold protein YncE
MSEIGTQPSGRIGRHAWTRRASVFAYAALGVALLPSAPAVSAVSVLVVKPILVVSGPAPGIAFKSPRAIAIDGQHDEVLLANTGDHRIEIFSLGGDRRARFIHRVQGTGGAWVDGAPVALAVDRAGRIFVSDALASYVDVLDYRGRSVARLELPAASAPARDATRSGPGALAIVPDGGLLVAERGGDSRVHRFGPDLALVGSWGVSGPEPGQLSAIAGLAVGHDGEVIIVCAGTQLAVQIFSPAGEYLRGFGVHDIGPGNFSLPSGVAVSADDRIWVSDEIRQIVQVFEPSGQFKQAVGIGGRGPGEFRYPSALASDGKDLVAVAEREGNRFQLLSVQ